MTASDGRAITPLTERQMKAVRTLVRHTTYKVGSTVGCAICAEMWPCYEVERAKEVLADVV